MAVNLFIDQLLTAVPDGGCIHGRPRGDSLFFHSAAFVRAVVDSRAGTLFKKEDLLDGEPKDPGQGVSRPDGGLEFAGFYGVDGLTGYPRQPSQLLLGEPLFLPELAELVLHGASPFAFQYRPPGKLCQVHFTFFSEELLRLPGFYKRFTITILTLVVANGRV